jgi:hypothetical protein
MSSHVSKTALPSISWSDVTPKNAAPVTCVGLSYDGSLAACSDGTYFYFSTDGGSTWTKTALGAVAIAISDATALAASVNLAGVPSNWNGSWSTAFNPPPPEYTNFQAVKADGTGQYANLIGPFVPVVANSANANGLDPDTFARQIMKESSFVNTSPGGLMQFNTQNIAQAWGAGWPATNYKTAIPAGAAYMANLLGQFGNIGLALAAYNAGPGTVNKWLAAGAPINDPVNFAEFDPSATTQQNAHITYDYVQIITGVPVQSWTTRGYAIIVADKAGDVRISRNSASNWAIQSPPGAMGAKAVAISGDGLHGVAAGATLWTLR